jgi:hypothetical protein
MARAGAIAIAADDEAELADLISVVEGRGVVVVGCARRRWRRCRRYGS